MYDAHIRRNTLLRELTFETCVYFMSCYLARKQLPTLRLEIDIQTMPPGSPQRLRFEEDFGDDLSKILGVPSDWVRVHTLRPATGADWMVEVVFQIETDTQTDVAQVTLPIAFF